MIRRPPRSTLDRSSAASDVYKRQPLLSTVTGLLDAVSERPVPFPVVAALRVRVVALVTAAIFVPGTIRGPLMLIPATTSAVLAQVMVVVPSVTQLVSVAAE